MSSPATTTGLHSLLKRQLKRFFGSADPPPELADFVTAVNTAYFEADEDRAMLERSLDLSSQELLEANTRLRSESERLTITLHSIGEGVITTDVAGRITLVNRVARDLSGWSTEDALGQPIEQVFHVVDEGTQATLEGPLTEVLIHQTEALKPRTGRLIQRRGESRLIVYSLAPIRDDGDELGGLVVAFRDLTEERKLEAERVRASRLESVGVLAGGIAHDFNNILTLLMGNLSLARALIEQQPQALPGLLDEARLAGDRAKDLTHQLLTFSKGGAPIRRAVALGKLLEQSTTFALRGSNVLCELEIPENLWLVHADEGQLSQVINNLVINADQAMPGGGRLEVGAENLEGPETVEVANRQGRAVRVWVRDQGPGIPAEILDHIFDPYFTTKETGTGLGLAMSYAVVQKHDGRLRVASEPGVGTTFWIDLPAAVQGSARTAARALEPVTPGKAGRVLLMDDEESMLILAERMLLHLGYRVRVAKNGTEALDLSATALEQGDPFDVMILDLTIPGDLGGREIAQSLLEHNPKVRLIASSGYSNAPVMATHTRYGFRGILPKPYDLDQMARVLDRVLETDPEG